MPIMPFLSKEESVVNDLKPCACLPPKWIFSRRASSEYTPSGKTERNYYRCGTCRKEFIA